MKPEEIKKLIAGALDTEADTSGIATRLESEGVSYDFSDGFTDKVTNRLFSAAAKVNREIEFVRNMNFAFTRIALTGIAAIVILLITIFIAQGSLSLNSVLGIDNPDIEGMVCLLTGN